MKKILLILGILTLICVNCAFADDQVNYVLNQNISAINHCVGAVPWFNQAWVECTTIIDQNDLLHTFSTDPTYENGSYVLFPCDVVYGSSSEPYSLWFDFALLYNSRTFSVIPVDNSSPYYNDLYYCNFIGTSVYGSGTQGYIISVKLDSNLGTILNSSYGAIHQYDYNDKEKTTLSQDGGTVWQTTVKKYNTNDYYLVSQNFNLNGSFGLYYSLQSNKDLLHTYGPTWTGPDHIVWDRVYTEQEYVIPVFRSPAFNQVNATISITDNSIVFNGSPFYGQQDLDVNSIWNYLKVALTSLIEGLTVVVGLFTVVFAFLPFEIRQLVFTGLMLSVLYLVIKAIRGG